MKAFVISLVVILVVSAGAALGLQSLGFSSAESYSTENVRL